jgi:hypothetical protein
MLKIMTIFKGDAETQVSSKNTRLPMKVRTGLVLSVKD